MAFLWERLSAAIIAAGCRSHRSNRVLQNKHQAAGQALATCRNRNYALPVDVKSLAVPVLSHRSILKTEARLKGRTAEDLPREILDTVPVPAEERRLC
jgi:MoxR-like ATPase